MPENKHPKVTAKRTAWEGSFIRTVLLEYLDSNGKLRNWEAVERINCSGIVVVIPVTKEGDLLLIRQFRPALDRYVIEFPAGLNDRGESLVDAARRELIEETGFTGDSFQLLAEGPVSSGLSSEVLTVYLAAEVTAASRRLREKYPVDETEEIEVIRTPLMSVYDTIREYCEKGDVADLKIYGFIELARGRMSNI